MNSLDYLQNTPPPSNSSFEIKNGYLILNKNILPNITNEELRKIINFDCSWDELIIKDKHFKSIARKRLEDLFEHDVVSDNLLAIAWVCEKYRILLSKLPELHQAVILKQPERVKKLLTPTVIDLFDSKGRSPLYYAVLGKDFELVDLLLQAGAKINLPTNSHPLLLIAHQQKDNQIFTSLLKHGADINQVYEGETLLTTCVRLGQLNLIKKLVEEYQVNINDIPKDSQFALEVAIDKGQVEIIRYFMEKKVGINQIKKIDKEFIRKTIDLIEYPEIAQFVLTQVASLERNENWLSYAIYRKNTEVVKFLIERGANVNFIDKEGESLLLKALNYCNDSIIIRCLVEHGAEVNFMDKEGNTAFMKAVFSDRLDIVKYLVEQGAEIKFTDKEEQPLLIKAISYHKSLQLIQYLIEKGANIHLTDKEGNSALMEALYRNELDIFKYLVEQGADVNATDRKGESILMKAIYKGQIDICKYLIEQGANVNSFFHYLVEHKVDMNFVNANFLFFVCCYGNLESAKYFLNQISDPQKLFITTSDKDRVPLSCILKSKGIKNYKEINQLIYEKFPQFYSETKEILYRKLLGHVFEIADRSLILTKEQKQINQINLAGIAGGSFFWKTILRTAKSLLSFYEENQINFPLPESIGETLTFAAKSSQSQELLTRWSKGKPVFINIGYEYHQAYILLFNDLLLICDRGGDYPPLKIFNFKKSLLNEAILKEISMVQLKNQADYQEVIWRQLPQKLKFTQTEVITRVENQVPLTNQKIGNCGWKSMSGILFAFFMLDRLNTDHSTDSRLENIVEEIVDDFNYFYNCLIIKFFDRYSKIFTRPDYPYLRDEKFLQIIKDTIRLHTSTNDTLLYFRTYKVLFPEAKLLNNESENSIKKFDDILSQPSTEENTLKEVSQHIVALSEIGDGIVLQDDSKWLVHPRQRIIVLSWVQNDDLFLKPQPQFSSYQYILYNRTTQQAIEVNPWPFRPLYLY